MFDVSEDQIMKRIRNDKRDTELLGTSPHGGNNFEELYHKQKLAMEKPTQAELDSCYKTFTINEHNVGEVLEAAAALVRGAEI